MVRGIDVKPDDLLELGGKLRIVGELEAPDPMRLKTMGAPDPLHRADADPCRLSHRRAGPMTGARRRPGQGHGNHTFDHFGTQRRDARGPGLVSHQAIDALGFETLAPAVDRVPALSALPHDPAGAQTVGRQQHDPRPPYMLLRAVAICHHRLQPAALAGTQGNPLAHFWPPSYPHARIAECEPIR